MMHSAADNAAVACIIINTMHTCGSVHFIHADIMHVTHRLVEPNILRPKPPPKFDLAILGAHLPSMH